MKIAIPNPCSENWANMTPQQKGRFCDTCQKCVIDFTQSSDKEIYDFLKTTKGNVCGHFNKTQLDRALKINALRHNKPLGIAASLLFLSTLSFGNEREVPPQYKTIIYEKKPNLDIDNNSKKDRVNRDTIIVRGRVVYFENDTLKEPMPGAAIVLKGTTLGTLSDIDGLFELHIPKKNIENDTLVISSVGFESREIPLINFSQNDINQITLILNANALQGEVAVLGGVHYVKHPKWYRFKNSIKRFFNRIF